MKFYKSYYSLIPLMFSSSILYNKSIHWHPTALKSNTKGPSLHALLECLYISSPFYHHFRYLKLLFQLPFNMSISCSCLWITTEFSFQKDRQVRSLHPIWIQIPELSFDLSPQCNNNLNNRKTTSYKLSLKITAKSIYMFQNNILFSLNCPL